MSNSEDKHGGVAADHSRQLPRLRRIEGQIRGLQQMIHDERYCGDVIDQINAAVAALRQVQAGMLRDHVQALAEASLSPDMPEAERRKFADEIVRLTGKLL